MAEFCFSSGNLRVLLGDLEFNCKIFKLCKCSCKYIENELLAPCVFAAFVIRAMTGEDVTPIENSG